MNKPVAPGNTVAEEILRQQTTILEQFPEAVIFGLGINDPKGVFGTTLGLFERFGENRVFETPTAENASLGLAVGLSIAGFKPIVVHQRLDFFLLAMDQLVNSAAKWRYMFGDTYKTPMIIRLIVGRGWGQGPTHSQNLHSWFTHIPGLRVFFPSSGEDFGQVFEQALHENYPTIVIEDRWVHQLQSRVSNPCNLNQSTWTKLLVTGNDLTLLTFGFNVIIGFKLVEFFRKLGVGIELIDLVALKPLDLQPVINSVNKTRKLLVVDSGFELASIGSYIAQVIYKSAFMILEQPIEVITSGDHPEPTSHGIIKNAKINAISIANVICKMSGIFPLPDFESLEVSTPDVPNESFYGPF